MKRRPKRKRVVTEYFDDQSPLYFYEHYRTTDEKYPVLYLRHKYILEMLGSEGRGRALDVGCGSGAMMLDLYQRGCMSVGADLSPSMIKNVLKLFAAYNTPKPLLTVVDIEHLPYAEDSFNYVFCAGVIEYLERDDEVLQEIARVLQPQGIAFISVTNAVTPLWFFETAGKLLGLWDTVVSLARRIAFPKTRVHVPSAFANKASRFNLVEVDRAYFHFTPFPFPLDRLCPALSLRTGLILEKLSQTRWGFLGRGCIIKMMKQA
ncbi:MAG: class I SAM-dependent methyltransferase [Candidatus Bathyarchaeota archaeon]|nr:class I SAM-dependent methyltransferase [Candidatus Bathyarchaeota archaeon]